MTEPENIFAFKLTLTDSFPEIWRRVLVPDECTLSDLHYMISYFEPTYLDIGDINCALGLIFPARDDANPFAQFNQLRAN